ncbi:hypothetical protein RJ640_005542 [Escallonia rubra]|uniref:pectinesterase n=1 Tax=Escallonia rubra TaxID=112253 RepID=A0AA88UAR9_9ASTE|nr:hypothetical protein RJ640_005542 [Escallonia rubra]
MKYSTSPSPLRAHICDKAHDRVSCMAMVSEITSARSIQTNDIDLLQVFLEKYMSHLRDAVEMTKDVSIRINNPKEQAALADCLELMDMSKDRLMDSVVALGYRTAHSRSDAHAWLSSVLTNHVTCLDGLDGPARSIMEPSLENLISRARTSLAMVVAISPLNAEVLRPLNGDFPSWVTSRDRKLLEAFPNVINANVVVAKDGSGNYKTIQEAVASAPNNGKSRYVIYIKKGTYKENIEIGKTKTNVMITGDGMDSTIITGSLNVVDGSTTFKSATVAAVGDGFIAQDLCFQNTAGPEKHQAVALRVGADQSVINRCRIDAYQDTLYTHTLRQFYRDCYITGTVDFIFGDAAVVFQNCQLVARKPMSGQGNMVTAQGRTDPNQNTGTSIQSCNIIASADLEPVKGSIKSYLGRPWKEYSRTVVMQSYIGDHIDATGWSVWTGDFALKTLYYGEYSNRGPGAGTAKRVSWPGYRVITSAAEARKFTVAELIQGGAWIKSSGVTYTEGLLKYSTSPSPLKAHICDKAHDRVSCMAMVMDSVVALGYRTAHSRSDAHAWLSSVLTNHVTCLDGLDGPARSILEPSLENLISRARTSLAMVVAISPPNAEVLRPLNGDFPSWVTPRDRKLLEAFPNDINANVVVAKDGSGNYKTIQEAVASAPNKGKSRYVIYVKKGTYKENIEIGKAKKNVMITGDGMDSTIITGSLNVVDGSTTFKSATVAAVGDGFIAQDLCFQNTAGPQKHQAVALRVGADQSVINRCRIDAYQDTLYTHTLRQFYRDCYVTGTVDFIFGNAAVVLQNCQLVARKPMSGQGNMVTAQGRTDPNQNTGTSIQSCNIIASSDLEPVKGSIKSYLGRPWKEYSRTVVMQSYIGDHIDASGWSIWTGDFALKTLYYGEYSNRGPGAGTAKRVSWPGYHVITSAAEARKFTVAELIQGGAWLKSSGVTYTEGL